jgi:hypothetical protein
MAVVVAGSLLMAQVTGGVPGSPLAGVTPVEFEEFRLGLDDFLEVETSDEGLGPAFNGTSCSACHSVPAVGGTGNMAEPRVAARAVNSSRSIPRARRCFTSSQCRATPASP